MKEKQSILAKKLGEPKNLGEEYLYKCYNNACPSLSKHKLKLSVNFKKNVYQCWVCGLSGPIRKLIRRFQNDKAFIREWMEADKNYKPLDSIELFSSDEEEQTPRHKIELPEEFVSLVDNDSKILASARKYLDKREFEKKDYYFWKPGFCQSGEYSGRIVFPSFDIDGDINFFTGRTIFDDIKYKKAEVPSSEIVFNELYLDWERPIVLVEGVFDAIKAGANSLPILGSSLDEKHLVFREIVKHDSTVILALDPDAEKKTYKIAHDLLKYDVCVKLAKIRPYQDIGDMPKLEAMKRLEKATPFNKNELLQARVQSLLEWE